MDQVPTRSTRVEVACISSNTSFGSFVPPLSPVMPNARWFIALAKGFNRHLPDENWSSRSSSNDGVCIALDIKSQISVNPGSCNVTDICERVDLS
jgi:hypothetical protein